MAVSYVAELATNPSSLGKPMFELQNIGCAVR